MRSLEHRVASVRAALRRARARRIVTDPHALAPARLVLRLDDGDADPAQADDHEATGADLGDGDVLTPAQWNRLLVAAVEWLGPLPVTVRSARTAGSSPTAELVRFAHRLECPTTLVTDGPGLDRDRVDELIDCGLDRLRVRVGGVTADTHGAVVGSDHADAVTAVTAAVAARADRGAALDVEVALPWRRPAEAEARAVAGWARQVGADGFRVVAPWRATALPMDPELLDELAGTSDTFHRTPAAALAELHAMAAHQDGGPGLPREAAPSRRRRSRCPVGGQRLELTAHGCLRACPFHAPVVADLAATGVLEGEADRALDLRAIVAGAAGPHLQAIASCERACAHPELVPAPVLAGTFLAGGRA